MKLFKRIPTWIKRYPIKLDRAALVQLSQKSKGSFEQPREMNFCLNGVLNDRHLLKELVQRISDEGWECSIRPDVNEPSKLSLTATKRNYIVTEDSYTRDTAFFNMLAGLYNTQYDGWFAKN